MINSPKKITGITVAVLGLSKSEEAQLQRLAAAHKGHAWDRSTKSPLLPNEKALVEKFTQALKQHLHTVAQREFCCYCGDDLSTHKMSYDLDHIDPKDGKCMLVFDVRNLAIICKDCNGLKLNTKITVFTIEDDIDQVLPNSSHYRIVHPHFDVWSDHFRRDRFNRVVPKRAPKNRFTKAFQTIEICGIHKRNGKRLSRHFDYFNQSVQSHEDWLSFYTDHMSSKENRKPRIYKRVLDKILALDPAGTELLDILGIKKDTTP